MGEKYPKLQDKCFSYFKYRIYEKGVETLKPSSWEDFRKVAEIFNGYKDYYIWRGQRCHSEQLEDNKNKERWKLISTFDRFKKFSKKKDRKKELDKILNDFKNTHNIDFSTENEIWAFKQHYGPLPTPLLDWTTDPYIATYFTFYEQGTNKQCNRVVYALNKAVQRLILKVKNAKKEILSIDRFVEFLSDHNPKNLRAEKQKGTFTKALNGIDIEKIVWKYSIKRYEDIVENKRILLVKILIPDKFRDECLNYLEKSMNITHNILFPN